MEPLFQASQSGSINGLYAAIQIDPRILSTIDEVPFVGTPLHVAAGEGHIEYVMEMMRLKPSFATKSDQNGYTPIHIALHNNHTQMVDRLIEVNSELVRAKGREGLTPLHFVVENGNLHLLKRFLSVCPKSIEDVTVRNETSLHIALKNNMFDVFEVLLDCLKQDDHDDDDSGSRSRYWKKRILNCKDVQGNTLFHIAASRSQLQAMKLLKNYDTLNPGQLESNTSNNNGQTALDLASLGVHDSLNIVELLRQFGAEIVHNEGESLKREEIYNWRAYFKFDYGRDKPDRTRSDLLVVAVLMATATYQAGLSPPGGLKDDKSLLASEYPYGYTLFIVFNSLGFFVSLETIMVLIYNYPLYWEIYAAMFGMIITYDSALSTMSPPGYTKNTFTVVSIFMPMLIPITSYLVRRWRKKRQRSPRAYRRHENS